MGLSFTGKKRIRKSFGRIPGAVEMPNLIEVQKHSYEQFLMKDTAIADRPDEGLQAVFKSVFPVKDFSERALLEFVSYEFEPPKYDVEECVQRDMTYAAPLKVKMRLIVFDVDEETGSKSVKDIKEQDVYMGDIPLMTDKGTFIVNGTERVIVSQMHRSPGVFFDHDRGKTHASGKYLFAARIIPYRGSWLDFEFDAKDILHVRIDRRRKLPATTLLYALGLDKEEILSTFYGRVTYEAGKDGWTMPFVKERWRGIKPQRDLIDAKSGEVVAAAGKKISARAANKMAEDGLEKLLVSSEELMGKFAAEDLVNAETGEIFAEAGDELTEEVINAINEAGVDSLDVLDIDGLSIGGHMRTTLAADKNDTREQALIDIYRVMRPGEPPTPETAEALFAGLFFDPERYDLSPVGRVKMNMRLDLECPDDVRVLRQEDIIEVLRVLLDLRDGKGEIDDIDNLGNRRVRSVGELMENQYRVGLLRMERAIKERMGSVDIETVMPHDLVNAKPAAAAVREFFGSSQLSQFMDQTNPLSEVTHKRRMSALGPGGLTRERAGFEVRDVHPTHYGRICPIETPEGPNIGLINSLSTYARVNKYGFIESPYRKVENGKLTDQVDYLSAMQESRYSIAQANAGVDENGMLANEFVNCRVGPGRDATLVPREDVDYIDVSPKQVVSVAASLIPFLENDDANRALMGSNMQRQAVPLVKAEAPLVGTGMEAVVARDSGAAVAARRDGVVEQVDAQRIVVRATGEIGAAESGVDIYRLSKFQRSNQSTAINQRPIVRVGDNVRAGDIIADGPSTDLGDLALGRNVLVAFMPWNGYNFEDSILISERIVRDDVFTSVHLEEFEVMARDTKLGPEEITRDIPNVGEEALRNLDEAGIVAIGAEVEAGDILVGKVTPKGESPMTPEEKLLRAIFGEKASDVRDTSLRLPPGTTGTIVEVRVFNRHGVDKDERAIAIEREEIERLGEDRDDELAILERDIYGRLREILIGKSAVSGPKGFKKGEVTAEALEEVPASQWWKIGLEDEAAMAGVEALKKQYDESKARLDRRFEDKVEKLQRGDEMPPGVMKMVKVFVAVKRKLQPGDKMAGRHGNKGVISKINPIEDMPFLEDGTSVDIVLNPLGVPSRMNVGQILETHLGWACKGLGRQIGEAYEAYKRNGDQGDLNKMLIKAYGDDQELPETEEERAELGRNLANGVPIATPVFDGAREDDIVDHLQRAGFDKSGQSVLYDGRTGDQFKRPVTVGIKYLLKLHHLVDDKIHARSIGPYSLVTQQPLGGKAQFGGQRFGEMEVWALQAYGAAYTLQEMLTVKSDDVAGRTKVYEAIVRGDNAFEAGIPESFNVLVKEMRSLGLNVELVNQ
ncbi:MAG: DNA-directed RNA polymerase subunit beta [Oceanicaulis sp.]|jgi:DNA-directed RNA polymerase subunit beta|uniref:DNA-directed RNA polymerase subunit beta n=1 Tax=unclassified Oceanicaulis TaxID=2632123 RepID=UPI000066D62A|nr:MULTISPECIES: DNA-directed RNA polymerase subunit beta [unclassified Oceanicaulis]EAP91248.1 DNA-directed RNA polymerase beta subunit [Oceanicaulis sp. HTCC2633]MBC38853.1 DNA-directed RNA polymerase subunit beta [Oceanicaulis sp.]